MVVLARLAAILFVFLALADQALDCAWQQGEGIKAALEAAKRLSVLVGQTR